jgi:mRNA-degrading endonuclease toxin of MazEF toxin-antitoxin module
VPIEPVRHKEPTGVILADHLRTVDWRRRGVRRICKVTPRVVDEVVARIEALIVNPEE